MTPVQSRARKAKVRRKAKVLTPEQKRALFQLKLTCMQIDPNLAPELPLLDEPKPQVKITPAMVQIVHNKLSATLMRLMKVSPVNPQLRMLIVRRTGLTVPTEIVGYDEMIHWLYEALKPPPAPPQAPSGMTMSIAVSARGMETGRCTYCLPVNAQMDFGFSPKLVVSFADNCSSWGELFVTLADHIEETIKDQGHMQRMGPTPIGFSDFDSGNDEDRDAYENVELELSEDILKAMVMDVLRQYLPAKFARLFPGEDQTAAVPQAQPRTDLAALGAGLEEPVPF